MTTIHEQANEKIELAQTYAEDGAFESAARLLLQAAQMYADRAEQIQREMDEAATERCWSGDE